MTRLVQLTSFDPPRAPWELRRKELIPLAPERVWQALTAQDELRCWWCESADVDLRLGGHYYFAGSNVYGHGEDAPPASSFEITALVPNQRLEFRWPLLGELTTVTYELANLMETTELRLTHTAERAPGSWPFGSDRPNWWWIALPALRTYLETGRTALAIDYGHTGRTPAARFVAHFTTFPWVVWSKLTLPGELAKWWGERVEVHLEPGGAFTLGVPDHGPSEIIALETEQRLVHDWVWSDSTRSEVEWLIEGCEDDTRVTLTDRGPWAATARRDARLIYWASTLLHLKQMSERGVTPREYQEP